MFLQCSVQARNNELRPDESMAHDSSAPARPADDPSSPNCEAVGVSKSEPSPTIVLLVGGVSLVIMVYLSWQSIVVNHRPFSEWTPEEFGLLWISWFITLVLLGTGVFRIRLRRRYLATTSPARRAVLDTQSRAEMRRMRLNGGVGATRRARPPATDPAEPPPDE